jgi:hypothetical protein
MEKLLGDIPGQIAMCIRFPTPLEGAEESLLSELRSCILHALRRGMGIELADLPLVWTGESFFDTLARPDQRFRRRYPRTGKMQIPRTLPPAPPTAQSALDAIKVDVERLFHSTATVKSVADTIARSMFFAGGPADVYLLAVRVTANPLPADPAPTSPPPGYHVEWTFGTGNDTVDDRGLARLQHWFPAGPDPALESHLPPYAELVRQEAERMRSALSE